jgi:hypothetical protein
MADPGNAMTLDDRVVEVDEAMREVGGYPPQWRSSTSFNAWLRCTGDD